MKLSGAIREGAKKRPQFIGELFGRFPSGQTGSCALGAAAEACGVGKQCWDSGSLNALFGLIDGLERMDRVDLPCGCPTPVHMTFAIAHLNDDHRWSREAIAEWVEVVENKLEAEKAAKAVAAEPVEHSSVQVRV